MSIAGIFGSVVSGATGSLFGGQENVLRPHSTSLGHGSTFTHIRRFGPQPEPRWDPTYKAFSDGY